MGKRGALRGSHAQRASATGQVSGGGVCRCAGRGSSGAGRGHRGHLLRTRTPLLTPPLPHPGGPRGRWHRGHPHPTDSPHGNLRGPCRRCGRLPPSLPRRRMSEPRRGRGRRAAGDSRDKGRRRAPRAGEGKGRNTPAVPVLGRPATLRLSTFCIRSGAAGTGTPATEGLGLGEAARPSYAPRRWRPKHSSQAAEREPRTRGKATVASGRPTHWLTLPSFTAARLPCSRAMFSLADDRHPSSLIGPALRSSGWSRGDRPRAARGPAPSRTQARRCWVWRPRPPVPCAKTNSR